MTVDILEEVESFSRKQLDWGFKFRIKPRAAGGGNVAAPGRLKFANLVKIKKLYIIDNKWISREKDG